MITVTDPMGKPVKDAEVLLLNTRRAEVVAGKTDEKGTVELSMVEKGSVVVFCAHSSFTAFRKKGYDSANALDIKLKAQKNCGSVVSSKGSFEIPGLSGRLSTMLDINHRNGLFAQGMSINNGAEQPILIQVGTVLDVKDGQGNRFEITIVDKTEEVFLIDYKRKK